MKIIYIYIYIKFILYFYLKINLKSIISNKAMENFSLLNETNFTLKNEPDLLREVLSYIEFEIYYNSKTLKLSYQPFMECMYSIEASLINTGLIKEHNTFFNDKEKILNNLVQNFCNLLLLNDDDDKFLIFEKIKENDSYSDALKKIIDYPFEKIVNDILIHFKLEYNKNLDELLKKKLIKLFIDIFTLYACI